jgi:hypothetical protein
MRGDRLICDVTGKHIMCLRNEFWTEEECYTHLMQGPHCGRCNKDLHGWQRDDIQMLQEAIPEEEEHFQGSEEEMQ